MAVNTAALRQSAAAAYWPAYLHGIFPDGTIDRADRQSLNLFYGGIPGAEIIYAEGYVRAVFVGKISDATFTGKVSDATFTGG